MVRRGTILQICGLENDRTKILARGNKNLQTTKGENQIESCQKMARVIVAARHWGLLAVMRTQLTHEIRPNARIKGINETNTADMHEHIY